MSREETKSIRNGLLVSPRQIGALFLCIALFAPAYVIIYWAFGFSITLNIFGMIWLSWYNPELWAWQFELGAFAFANSIMYTLLRPVFAVLMWSFYKGESSRRLTLLVGLITDLQPIIANFPTVLWFSESNLILRLPLPFALLIAVILMRLIPPQQTPKLWLEREEEEKPSWLIDDNEEIVT